MQAQSDRASLAPRLARALWRGLLTMRVPLRVVCLIVGIGLLVALLPAPGPRTPVWLVALAGGLESLGRAPQWWARLGRAGLGLLGALTALIWLSDLLPRWHLLSSRAWRREVLLPWPVPRAEAALADTLAIAGQRLRPLDSAGRYAVGSLRPWPMRALSVESGLLVILIAVVTLWGFSWRGPLVILPVDSAQPLQTTPALTARIEQIALVPRLDGTPRNLSAEIALASSDEPQEPVTVGLGRPARRQGLAIHLVGYGPAMRVQATDNAGEPVLLREVLGAGEPVNTLRVPFDDAQQEKWLALPDRSFLVRLLYYGAEAAPEGKGPLNVQVVRGRDGQVLADEFLAASGVVVADGLRLQVDFELYVTLQARREPHRPIAWLGAVLLALGALATVLFPSRQGWTLLESLEGADTRCTLVVAARPGQIAWAECALNILAEKARTPLPADEAEKEV